MEQTVDEVADRLNKIGVPSSPINTVDRVAKDPQIAGDRNMFPVLDQPVAGKVKITNNQLKFTNHKADAHVPAPLLGQHNEDIFCGVLGLDKAELQRLKDEKVI